MLQHVTRTWGCNITVTSEIVLVGNNIKEGMRYQIAGSRTSHIEETNGIGLNVYGLNDIVIVECTWINMGIPVPLLIIDGDHVCAIPEPRGNTLKGTMR